MIELFWFKSLLLFLLITRLWFDLIFGDLSNDEITFEIYACWLPIFLVIFSFCLDNFWEKFSFGAVSRRPLVLWQVFSNAAKCPSLRFEYDSEAKSVVSHSNIYPGDLFKESSSDDFYLKSAFYCISWILALSVNELYLFFSFESVLKSTLCFILYLKWLLYFIPCAFFYSITYWAIISWISFAVYFIFLSLAVLLVSIYLTTSTSLYVIWNFLLSFAILFMFLITTLFLSFYSVPLLKNCIFCYY